MHKEFNEIFQIKNSEVYLATKKIVDCHNCKRIIIDPRLCKECGFMYCNTCLINNSKCPRCFIYPTFGPTFSNKQNLDIIILKCKYDCEVPLSQAYII